MALRTVIKCKVEDQTASLHSYPVVSSGGLKETEIQVTFSEHWERMVIKAVFIAPECKAYHADVENGVVVVPHEVTDKPGQIAFGFYGVNGDEVLRTSTMLRYNIAAGTMTGPSKPSDPTPDVYTQILAKLSSLSSGRSGVVIVDSLPEIGEVDKIYVQGSNLAYYTDSWHFLGLTLGEGESNAFPGNRGKKIEDELAKIKMTLTREEALTILRGENING